MTGAKIEGYNSMFNGHKEGDIEGELGDLTFGSTAGNFVGNASDETERMFLQSSRRNQGCSHPDYAYMPARAPPSQGNHAREAKPRFHDISSDRFISSRDSSSYQGADYRAEVREPSWHGTHHAQHLERNFTSQQYGAQQVQGPERDTASPWYSNRQVQGPERDIASPQMNESRLRHPDHNRAEEEMEIVILPRRIENTNSGNIQ